MNRAGYGAAKSSSSTADAAIVPLIRVRRAAGRSHGLVRGAIPVALGRAGIKANKREGDGATPRGRFRLMRLWWRADRARGPAPVLPVRRMRRTTAGARIPPTGTTTGRSGGRPVNRRPAVARRPPLRLHHRDRPQHAPARRRPRQRRVHPCGAPDLSARPPAALRARCAALAAAAGAARAEYATNRYCVPKRRSPNRARRKSPCRPRHASPRIAIAAEIGAHAHRQEFQAVAPRDLGGEREMRRRRLAERRNAHQPGDLRPIRCRGSAP